MTKSSALGSSFFVGTHDVSGDIGTVSAIDSMQAIQDVSSIQAFGTERIGLRRDGAMSYASFWNVDGAVPVLDDIDSGQEQISIVKGPGGIGAFVASLLAVKVKWTTVSGQDGSLGATGDAQGAAGVPVEWGRLLTIGKQTFAATEAIAAWQASHTYVLNDLVQPTTPNGRYYKATAVVGDSDSSEPTWPTVTGNTVVDGGVTWTDQGLIPNGIDRGSGSASNFGAAAYLHAFSIGSGSATVKVQDSADRIAWADVPGLAFSAVTGPVVERVVTGPTENIRRYVQVEVTGTFTNLVAAVSVVPYLIAQ